jgi:hypothetical protein
VRLERDPSLWKLVFSREDIQVWRRAKGDGK